jgi:hypothetical protein
MRFDLFRGYLADKQWIEFVFESDDADIRRVTLISRAGMGEFE